MPYDIRHQGSRTLYTEVRDALLHVGVYPDDANWMTLGIVQRLEEVFEFVPIRERKGLRQDVKAILQEIEELDDPTPEDKADFLVERLSLKWRFTLHSHVYQVPEE